MWSAELRACCVHHRLVHNEHPERDGFRSRPAWLVWARDISSGVQQEGGPRLTQRAADDGAYLSRPSRPSRPSKAHRIGSWAPQRGKVSICRLPSPSDRAASKSGPHAILCDASRQRVCSFCTIVGAKSYRPPADGDLPGSARGISYGVKHSHVEIRRPKPGSAFTKK